MAIPQIGSLIENATRHLIGGIHRLDVVGQFCTALVCDGRGVHQIKMIVRDIAFSTPWPRREAMRAGANRACSHCSGGIKHRERYAYASDRTTFQTDMVSCVNDACLTEPELQIKQQ